MTARGVSSCKLKITDKNLKRVLGRAEDSEVIFDTFQEYLGAIPIEAEFLVAEPDGHFIGKFRKLSYTEGDIKLLYSSEYGNGAVALNEVLGPVTEEILTKYQDQLNPLARAKLIPPVPVGVDPVSSDELVEGAGDSTNSLTADYDGENSKIKIEQFESTTGQDVRSDFEGTLDPRPSTLNRMVVKEALASAPGKYRTFIVKDSKDYSNEEGIEAEGEVLLVVHRLVYDEMAAELGRSLTLEEIKEAAVRVTDGQIGVEGGIYTIPLEGTSPNRNMGEDDQFFSRNHEARVQIYAEKYNVTEEEAEAHFRQGQSNMQALRDRANYDPVEVTTRPSLGFATGEQMSIGDFDTQYNLQGLEFSINLNKSKIVGRVYVKGTMNGQPVEMLTVPVNLTEKYKKADLEAIAARMMGGLASLDDIRFFSSIFGVNKRKTGPYMKIDGESFILMAGGKRIESLDQFNQSLAANNWPAVTNKIRGAESLSQHTILRAGKYVEVSPEEFLMEHLNTDGSLWTHRGKPVPYPANRYFYLDEVREAAEAKRPAQNTQETITDRVNTIFEDVQEYDRIVTSNAPQDIERKLIAPQAFTPTFRLSQSYKRLRSGLKVLRTKAAGMFGFNAPVGQEYFNSMYELRDNLPAIVSNYAQADLIAHREGLRAESQPTTLLGTDIPALELLKAEITTTTTDTEIEALLTPVIQAAVTERVSSKIAEKTASTLIGLQKQGIMETETMGLGTDTPLTNFIQINEANKLIADIENQIMFGDAPLIQGTSPDITQINDLPTETTFASVFSKEQQAPTQVVRSVVAGTTGGSAVETTARALPIAGSTVDGRVVRSKVPNAGSIESSLDEYEILDGIREVPFTEFPDMGELRYNDKNTEQRTKKLADDINESGEINPLIVVYDKDGAYILEGGHRFDALRELGAKSFPAKVVLDTQSIDEDATKQPQVTGAALLNEQVMTLDTYRMIQRLSGKWTAEDEANYQEELEFFRTGKNKEDKIREIAEKAVSLRPELPSVSIENTLFDNVPSKVLAKQAVIYKNLEKQEADLRELVNCIWK